MAKIRRTIRKLKPPRYQTLDEQLWPVIVALVVLGGFTMGSLLAYLRFDDPRWYANAITWLVVAGLVYGGAAVALTLVDNRTFRRSMQLAILLGLLLHAILLVVSIELEIFGKATQVFFARNDLAERRQPVTVPEYIQPTRQNRTRQDLERRVETETPPSEPEPLERQPPDPETTPPEPQPTPVPEPKQTVKPALVKQPPTEETSPRFSDQDSRLSRRMTPAQTLPATTAAATVAQPQPTPATPANVQAQEAAVDRRETQAQVARQAEPLEPTTTDVQPATTLARRTPQQAPQAESSATPTLERQVARPLQVPRTEVDLADAPSVARRTRPDEIQPQTTSAQRQATASPDRPQQPAEPTPEVERTAARESQRRQLRTQQQPELAQAPVAVPNQRTRATNRPQVATAASAVTPANAPLPTGPEPAAAGMQSPQPSATTADRQATADTQVVRAAAEPATPAPAATPPTPPASPTRPPQAPTAPEVAQAETPAPARRAPSPLQPAAPTAADNVAAAAASPGAAAATPQPQGGSLARNATQTPVAPALATPAEPAAPVPNATVQLPPRKSPTTAESPAAASTLAAAAPRRPTVERPAPATATAAEASPATPVGASGATAAAQPTAVAVTAPRQAAAGSSAAAASAEPAASAPTTAAAATAAPQIARRPAQSAGSEMTEASTAPAATPRRQTTAPQVAAATDADAAAAATDAAAPAPAPSAVAISAARQATASGVTGAPTGAAPALAAAGTASPAGTSQSATRRPSGEEAPTLAASPLASTARRQEVATAPNLTTIAADMASPAAATQGDSDQPRPSLATVARQASADPTAARSQPSLEMQAASTTTQIGRPASRPLQPGDAPSIAPDAPPAATVARATTRTAVAASPENVESPAAAEAARGVGSPTAEPARMALSKALTGLAGIGQGRNLDRAQPAADSPALIASAAARRSQATQETPPGPALSPQAAALVRRAAAGNQVPTASLQAQANAEIALAAGAQQADPLAASASAALARADAAAPAGPVTGTSGVTEVDLGPSRAVSEGQTGRGSGGGQPTLNFDTDAPRIARSNNVGGAPRAALASPTAAEVPTAPAATGGSQPLMPLADLAPTAVARSDAGGLSPSSGGPAQSIEIGPPTEVSLARSAAEPALARAELSQAVPDPAAAGGGTSDEEEEERKRRLARAAAQAIALATPTTAEGINAQAEAAGDARQALAALGASVGRTSAADAAASDPSSPAAQAAPGETASAAGSAPSVGRAEVPPDVPTGPATLAAGGAAVARSARDPATPSTSLQAALAGTPAGTTAAPGEQLAAAAATGVARAEAGQPVAANAAAGLAADVGQPESAAAASVARAEPGVDSPAAEAGTAAPQMARAGRPAPGAPPLEVAVVLPGAAGGTAGSRGAAGQPADAAATTLARTEPSVAAPVGGNPGDLPASLATEAAGLLPAARISRTAAAETAAGAIAAGGGQPDVAADAELAPTLARRSSGDAARAAPAGLTPTTAAAAPAGELLADNALAGAPVTDADAKPLAANAVRLAGGGGPAASPAADLDVPTSAAAPSGGELLAAAQYQRAEAAEGAIGEPELGGGTAAPTRAAVGPTLASDIRAQAVSLAGMPQSGGADDGRPLAALGGEVRNLPTGRVAPPSLGPVGAMAGQPTIDVAIAGSPGVAAGNRLTSPSTADGPVLGQVANLGAPLKRSERAAVPAGSVEVAMVDVPSRGSFAADARADADHSPGDALGDMDMSRQATEGGLAVNLDAVEGPGGLAAGTSVDVGLNNRRAVRDSMQVSLNAARFVRHQVGGSPSTSTAAIVPTESFRRRRPRGTEGGWGDGQGSPPPLTEETVDLGLNFLVRQQLADGSWSLQSIPGEPASLMTDTGATALALLAFQGAGYSHREHQYADVVRGGIDYLLKSQKPDGDLFLPMDETSNQSVWLYSHALATLALCEAYGMTQDPSLKDPAQKALNFILAAQHPERGGWRYAPQVGSDTSVSGWMMMALKSGELAGLTVPAEPYAKIRQWLDKSQASAREPHLYRYNPLAPNTPEQAHGRQTSKTMTAVGLLMRLYLGWQRDNPNMVNGAKYLAENLPSLGTARQPQRDTYYWYYATQVMFHMGGDYWQAWNDRLHPLLTEAQIKSGPLAGSWDPRGPIPDRWAPHAGRLYVTTMNILSLEVYYRHLPLYEDTLK
jgi:hypothetical protein